LFTLIMVARMSEQGTRLDRMILPFALLGPLDAVMAPPRASGEGLWLSPV
jgi:hypothetical protein